ncbi:MAG: cyclic nucleotide-binding domain-containing protein [Magnetococcales bacterium]|nr:cyclic nucleotide-binding domain-containing protein [Magnetococcales bacterium]
MKLMVKLIAKVPFFSKLSEKERAILAEDDSLFEIFADGEYIVRQGVEDDYSLYILMSGNVDVINESDDAEESILTMKEGAVFGEASFLASHPRTASVRAQGQATVFKMSPKASKRLDCPMQLKINTRLSKILVERLVHSENRT